MTSVHNVASTNSGGIAPRSQNEGHRNMNDESTDCVGRLSIYTSDEEHLMFFTFPSGRQKEIRSKAQLLQPCSKILAAKYFNGPLDSLNNALFTRSGY